MQKKSAYIPYRIMKKHGIGARTSRRPRSKNQYSTSKTSLPNVLKEVSVEQPTQLWAGDFTHFSWKRRTYYLAIVMDIYTRQVVGWHVSSNHSVELVVEALTMALGKRSKAPTIFHADHGSEYISEEYVSKLKANGITPSNSGKGKPWQNGFVESWNYRFKEELGDPNRFEAFDKLLEELYAKLSEYNTRRFHSKPKMTPDAFHVKTMKELEQAKEEHKSA